MKKGLISILIGTALLTTACSEEEKSTSTTSESTTSTKTVDSSSKGAPAITFEETELEFPKGRRNYQETDITCAYREFNEETGYMKDDLDMITNIQPFEEIFIGSNYKSYKHKYYLAYMKESDINKNNCCVSNNEVSCIKWLNIDECIKVIRPYNLEKINIINKIDNIIHNYNLY